MTSPDDITFLPRGQSPKLRVVWMGTHPNQYNGYSKVGFQLLRALHALHGDELDLHLFGFQNSHHDPDHVALRRLHPDVKIYDAALRETPRAMGFGFDQVKDYLTMVRPDVVFVYNDPGILASVLVQIEQMLPAVRASFKLVPYFDQVYPSHRGGIIPMLNSGVDAAVMFTPGWEACIKRQGLTVPTFFMRHGFDREVYYPVPRPLARRMFSWEPTDFLVLNLNRNVPRKRWDTTLMAWAEVVSRHLARPDAAVRSSPRLVIAAEAVGSWNLNEIYERELHKRGVPIEVGMRHVIFMALPQRMSDALINVLYSATDIGLNTCDGEGFGMCNFEHAGVGCPQVVPRVGGFVDFFDDDCAILVDPVTSFYIDSTRGEAGGEASMCRAMDVADAIVRYQDDPALRALHGGRARRKIAQSPAYAWATTATKLRDIVLQVTGGCRASDPPVKAQAQAQAQAQAPTLGDVMDILSLKTPQPMSLDSNTEKETKTNTKTKAEAEAEAETKAEAKAEAEAEAKAEERRTTRTKAQVIQSVETLLPHMSKRRLMTLNQTLLDGHQTSSSDRSSLLSLVASRSSSGLSSSNVARLASVDRLSAHSLKSTVGHDRFIMAPVDESRLSFNTIKHSFVHGIPLTVGFKRADRTMARYLAIPIYSGKLNFFVVRTSGHSESGLRAVRGPDVTSLSVEDTVRRYKSLTNVTIQGYNAMVHKVYRMLRREIDTYGARLDSGYQMALDVLSQWQERHPEPADGVYHTLRGSKPVQSRQ